MAGLSCHLTSRLVSLAIQISGLGLMMVSPAQAQASSALLGEPVTIHVLDVGHGASALIRTPHGKWAVIDGGPSRYLVDSAVPRYQVDSFALAVLSHRHSDHLGGLLHALATIPTNVLVADTTWVGLSAVARRFNDLVREKSLPLRAPHLDTLTIDGVRFIIIPPPPLADNENNRSVVVRLEYGQFSMLFPGDAEELERDWLLTHSAGFLRSSVLMAAYHGSIKGTSKEWLATVSPSAIVIPVGDRPTFRLPNAPAVDEYIRQVGDNRVYCTNRQGTILIFGYIDGRSAVRPERLRKSSCAFGADTLEVVAGGDRQIDYTALYTVPSDAGRNDRYLRPRVVIDREGIRFIQAQRLFKGTFLLGLIDSSSEKRSSRLDVPVRAQLTSSDEVSPTQLLLDHVNVPFESVTVTSRSPGDSVRVQVIPDIDPAGLSVTLPVRQTVLADASPKRIQGFGLQTALVSVRLLGGSIDSVEVDVGPDQGTVTTRRVMVHRGRSQDVTVRSSGIGVDSIRVISAAGRDVIGIVYMWPVVFLLAALLGGCIGVLARERRRKTWKARLREVLNGVFVGLIAAVGYAVGVNLLRVQIQLQGFSEAAVFLIAALATYSGLDLTPKTDDQKPRDKPKSPQSAPPI